MGCCAVESRTTLLIANTLIFISAAGALGVTGYIFLDVAAKSLTKVNLLTVIGIVSLLLMLFAVLGCVTAVNEPKKRCSKCLYLTILLVLFVGEFAASGLVFNVKNSLEVLKDHQFDVESLGHTAGVRTLHFLHDQLQSLYTDEGCKGGGLAPGSKLAVPLSFTEVHCSSGKVDTAFDTILKDNIETQEALDFWKNCTVDPAFTPAGEAASDFTQGFCGSEAHIITLAQKYARYLAWFPVVLAGLTFLLLIATICLMVQRSNGERPDHRYPLAGEVGMRRV